MFDPHLTEGLAPILKEVDVSQPHDSGEWIKWVIGLVLAGIVSYFTSQMKTDSAMARIEERENNHYAELKTSIDLMRLDVRELRRTVAP